jgi:hypothetical protein
MARVPGAGDGRNNRADFTACFMAKTARIQQGIARKQRPPETGCLGHNQPTTKELSRTHINTTTHSHTITATPSIHPSPRLRINQSHTTKITHQRRSKKTSPISRIVESST